MCTHVCTHSQTHIYFWFEVLTMGILELLKNKSIELYSETNEQKPKTLMLTSQLLGGFFGPERIQGLKLPK
jgi:hypothetical protein